MKILQKILIVVIILLLISCTFHSLGAYYDFISHPEVYETYSAPWYTSIMVTVVITIISVLMLSIICFVLDYIIKKRNGKNG